MTSFNLRLASFRLFLSIVGPSIGCCGSLCSNRLSIFYSRWGSGDSLVSRTPVCLFCHWILDSASYSFAYLPCLILFLQADFSLHANGSNFSYVSEKVLLWSSTFPFERRSLFCSLSVISFYWLTTDLRLLLEIALLTKTRSLARLTFFKALTYEST